MGHAFVSAAAAPVAAHLHFHTEQRQSQTSATNAVSAVVEFVVVQGAIPIHLELPMPYLCYYEGLVAALLPKLLLAQKPQPQGRLIPVNIAIFRDELIYGLLTNSPPQGFNCSGFESRLIAVAVVSAGGP